MSKTSPFIFAFICILLLGGFITFQKSNTPIILRDEKLNFTPKEFYITDIIDDRTDKSTVASLVYKDKSNAYITRPTDLKDGAATAIIQFINRNLNQDPSLPGVIISLKKFQLEETSLPGGRVSGHLSIGFSFSLQKNYGLLRLVDYTSGVRYTRPDAQSNMAEPTLRHSIEDALTWFNNWINTAADSDPRLAKAVRVTFTDYTEKPEGDTLYYAFSRPLTWDDFKEKPDMGKFDAEIFTSIGYIEQATDENGIINLNIAVKVELPKSDCWVKDKGRDSYALNHEQRHFDITKLVAEHFKQKISSMNLPDNYNGDINVEYLETLREMNRMQKQYDSETHHGTNAAAQAQWDEKIDKELKALGAKK